MSSRDKILSAVAANQPRLSALPGLDILKTGNLAAQNWTPQASGISIKPGLVDELEGVWQDFLNPEE